MILAQTVVELLRGKGQNGVKSDSFESLQFKK